MSKLCKFVGSIFGGRDSSEKKGDGMGVGKILRNRFKGSSGSLERDLGSEVHLVGEHALKLSEGTQDVLRGIDEPLARFPVARMRLDEARDELERKAMAIRASRDLGLVTGGLKLSEELRVKNIEAVKCSLARLELRLSELDAMIAELGAEADVDLYNHRRVPIAELIEKLHEELKGLESDGV